MTTTLLCRCQIIIAVNATIQKCLAMHLSIGALCTTTNWSAVNHRFTCCAYISFLPLEFRMPKLSLSWEPQSLHIESCQGNQVIIPSLLINVYIRLKRVVICDEFYTEVLHFLFFLVPPQDQSLNHILWVHSDLWYIFLLLLIQILVAASIYELQHDQCLVSRFTQKIVPVAYRQIINS